MNIIIFGKPGSGKGIISQNLKKHNFLQLSTGDLLRSEIKKGTPLGEEINKLLAQGLFASDETIFTLVDKFLSENSDKNIIFDGFPRNLKQAEELVKRNIPIKHIFNLNVSDEIVTTRATSRLSHPASGRIYNLLNPDLRPKNPGFDDLTGEPLVQRDDDKPEIIKKRLQVYREVTAPVYDYLKDKINTVEIDATLPLEQQISFIADFCEPSVKIFPRIKQ